MPALPFLSFVVFLALGLGEPLAAPYPFKLDSVKEGEGFRLVARNQGWAPVSLRVDIGAAENLAMERSWPLHVVVRPKSETTVAILRAADAKRSFRFAMRSSHRPGNYLMPHDDNASYRLPWQDGRSFVVSQAADGPLTTHLDAESRNALDFNLPEGTPVLAARDGVVIEAEASHRAGGVDRSLLGRANHVWIVHDDDSIAMYSHLAYGSLRVAIGDRVRSGQLLGQSGATGYASGPHLHFAVTRLELQNGAFVALSVPVRFQVGKLPCVFTPRYRQRLLAYYDTACRDNPANTPQ